MHKLTLNILISLIVQAKINGKGKLGNGRLFVRLLSVIADNENGDTTKEKDIISKFSDNPVKSNAYQKIDRILFDFLPTGNRFPADKITLHQFEKKIGIGRKTNWEQYRSYLAEMGKFCAEVLEQKETPALVNTLLNLVRQDDSIHYIFYANELISKNNFFGTAAHRKKICIEAFLLGILYQTIKNFSPADAGEFHLLHTEQRYFDVLFLGDIRNSVFRDDCEELKKMLSLDIAVPIKDGIQMNSIYLNDKKSMHYPLQIVFENKNIPSENIINITQKHIFLYGSGGSGKSTILQQLQDENCLILSLNQYHREIHEEILPDVPCWILIQILLKYYHQYVYRTFEICAAQEGKEPVLRQVSELLELFRNVPENWTPKYLLLLDGFNETLPELQECSTEELNWICENLKNVRVIITGRIIPQYVLFDEFSHVEVYGIPDETRNRLLSELPNYPDLLKNEQLIELLRLPLFLNMYLENQNTEAMLCTRGEILDNYVMHLNPKVKKYVKTLQFIIRYALPFAAEKMLKKYDYILTRADLIDAVNMAYDTYLTNERIYQNFILPQKFIKKDLLDEKESCNFTEFLVENTAFFEIDESEKLRFSHQYFRDYFAARYYLNLLEMLEISFEDTHLDEKEALFHKYHLGDIWFDDFCTEDIYRLIGEICGDYKNIPDKNRIVWYHHTILDDCLEMGRQFRTSCMMTWNIIKTMGIVRNGLICYVNFNGLTLPPALPCCLKFSDNGQYASSFRGCYLFSAPMLVSGKTECAAYSPDGKQLLLGLNGYVILWDVRAKRILHDYNLFSFTEPEDYFQNVEFSKDGTQFTITTQYEKFLVELNTGKILKHTPGLYGFYNISSSRRITAFSPDRLHFLINDVQYCVTGKREYLNFREQFSHFKNCDFCKARFAVPEIKENLSQLGAIIE